MQVSIGGNIYLYVTDHVKYFTLHPLKPLQNLHLNLPNENQLLLITCKMALVEHLQQSVRATMCNGYLLCHSPVLSPDNLLLCLVLT